MDSSMTEEIHSMFFEGVDMFLAGEYAMFLFLCSFFLTLCRYHFVEAKDKDFYMCNGLHLS